MNIWLLTISTLLKRNIPLNMSAGHDYQRVDQFPQVNVSTRAEKHLNPQEKAFIISKITDNWTETGQRSTLKLPLLQTWGESTQKQREGLNTYEIRGFSLHWWCVYTDRHQPIRADPRLQSPIITGGSSAQSLATHRHSCYKKYIIKCMYAFIYVYNFCIYILNL